MTYSRWPIWWARLALSGVAVALSLVVRVQLSDPEGRQMMIMSVFSAAFLFVLFLTWAHATIGNLDKVPRTRFMRSAATFGASCVAIGVFLIGAQADPAQACTKVASSPRPLWPVYHDAELPAIHPDHVGLLPRFSVTLRGATQAPISMVFLGSGQELLAAFRAAGWHVADRVTPRTALRAFKCGVLNKSYPSAPVLPVLLDGKLHDLAFQRTHDGSSRRRHHARWWLTDYTVEGRQVWVATASFDAGVGIGRLAPLPIHHIDPDIDAERDYIVHSLVATGLTQVTQEIRVTEPMSGKNAAGDRFFTKGEALVLA